MQSRAKTETKSCCLCLNTESSYAHLIFGYGSQFFFLKTNRIGFSVTCNLESYQRHYYNYFFFLDSKNENFLMLSPLYSQF